MDRKGNVMEIYMTTAAEEQESLLRIGTYRYTLVQDDQVENKMR
jgi:hypothetical protein